MTTYDAKTLEEAVLVFYRAGAAEHAAAHDWLNKAQASPQAWSFVWDLMKLEKCSEVQFFGATTLHSKLIRHWAEVPKEHYEELRQKLMNAIILFGSGPRIVLNRLCISLSAFIVQMYEDWPTGVEDVSHSLQTHQLPNVEPKMQIWIMMEIMCAIPDEGLAITTSASRSNMRTDLSAKAPYVLSVLEMYLESKCTDETLDRHDLETLQVAAKCASAWLRNYTFPLDTCTSLATSMVKLINKCYWNCMAVDGCLSAEENELTEWCLETLTSMLIQPDAHRYSANALDMIQLFLDSLTPITKNENVEDNQNEDIVCGIYTLFTTSIESHSRALIGGVIADSPQFVSVFNRLITQILQCTDKPGIYPLEESCSSISMGFWYMLQDEVMASDSEAGRAKMLELIRPVYAHLTRVLIRKSQQPDEDSLDRWSSDDLEMFRCYRQDICDTLLYCYEVLQNQLLVIYCEMLNDAIVVARADPRNWTQLEACVHAFSAISEQVDCDEITYIPQLMNVLNDIPYDRMNGKVLGTALETIGAYAEWFKFNTQYLPSVIQLLVRGLNSSQASQATLGLKDICGECQPQMIEYTEPLLQACQQSMISGKLKNSESVRLMFSIGKLMSMLPEEKLVPSLDALVSPCFEELQMIVHNGVTSNAISTRTQYRLNMVATLFTSLNTNPDQTKLPTAPVHSQQPVLLVVQKTLPIFKAVGQLFVHDHKVIEAISTALKHAMTNLQNEFMPVMSIVCSMIVELMQLKCMPQLLDLTKTCVLLYYRDKKSMAMMQQLHVEVSAAILRLLDETPNAKLSDYSDVIEMFYSFNAQLTKKIPDAFRNPGVDNMKLLTHALRALRMAEPAVIKHSNQFIANYILQSRQHPAMELAVSQCGGGFVQAAIECCGLFTPRTHIELFADGLLALSKKYSEQLIVWMKMLETPDYPSRLITRAEKDVFMKTIVKEKANKRIVQEQICIFAAKCRGLPLK